MTALRLHDYQELARDFLRNRRRAALFLDMGLGKTAASLSALEPQHLPVLVCAPKRVAENVWEEEVALWRPDLTIAIAKGDPKQRAKALRSGADIVVIGRDNLGDAVPLAEHFNTFIIDELSGFKSRSSDRWKHAKTIIWKGGCEYVWGLTGTPSPNGLLDLWAQIFLIDGGARLGSGITHYRARYFEAGAKLPSGVVVEWYLKPEAELAIHRKLEDLCLAMDTDGKVEVPELRFNNIEVPFTPAVRAAYKTMKRDLVVNMDELGLGLETHTAANAAVLGNKLAQMTAGAIYSDEQNGVYTRLHVEKVRACREIVDGTGGPVILFYRYAFELDALRAEFKNRLFTPNEPDLQKRWNAGELPILAAHPASIGHGLNLQKGPGRTIVWVTPTWSLEEFQQGNKRLARQGSAHPYVMVHQLVTPFSVDPGVYRSLHGKDVVQLALLTHLQSPL